MYMKIPFSPYRTKITTHIYPPASKKIIFRTSPQKIPCDLLCSLVSTPLMSMPFRILVSSQLRNQRRANPDSLLQIFLLHVRINQQFLEFLVVDCHKPPSKPILEFTPIISEQTQKSSMNLHNIHVLYYKFALFRTWQAVHLCPQMQNACWGRAPNPVNCD